MSDNRPIGVFDSGIGGLTVVKSLRHFLPGEDIIYLGDTARLPYGTKSPEVIKGFALQDGNFLISRGVKLIVVACHTVSSVALEDLKKDFPVPVIGVTEPGAKASVQVSKNKKIGVIGTIATIRSGKYEEFILRNNSEVEIIARATPLLVPLVEEGWIVHEITKEILRIYLNPLREDNIDTLLLGCTHYPVLKKVIQEVIGEEVNLVDPGRETAQEVKKLLQSQSSLSNREVGRLKIYLTDLSPNFEEIAKRFLGLPIEHVIRATLSQLNI